MNKEEIKDEKKEICFVMMPISDKPGYPEGHFQKIYEQIFVPAIEQAGYEPFRVDEDKVSTSIIVKIFEAIQASPMAICDLSSCNPNVMYELGIRQAYDKPVVLVQDEKSEKIFDVSGINTIFYQSNRLYENVLEAIKDISQAISETENGRITTISSLVQINKASTEGKNMNIENLQLNLLQSIIEKVERLERDVRRESNTYTSIREKEKINNNNQLLYKQNLLDQHMQQLINNNGLISEKEYSRIIEMLNKLNDDYQLCDMSEKQKYMFFKQLNEQKKILEACRVE